jgi:hypothetical protein
MFGAIAPLLIGFAASAACGAAGVGVAKANGRRRVMCGLVCTLGVGALLYVVLGMSPGEFGPSGPGGPDGPSFGA